MSYIPDALKQKESASKGSITMQGDYQQEYVLNQKLRFYRNLALLLGVLLALTVGFFIGKGLQPEKQENIAQEQVLPATDNQSVKQAVPQTVVANQTHPQIQ